MSRAPDRAIGTPALVVACIALAVSLSGTAVAAGIVANARHAGRADLAIRALNADKVQGRTAVQIAAAGARAGAQLPGPASTVAGLVTIKTAPWSFPPGTGGDVSVSCDPGQKAVGGGWEDPGGFATVSASLPTPDGTSWGLRLKLVASATETQAGTAYAVCLE